MFGCQIVLNTEIKHNPVAVLYGDTEFLRRISHHET